MQHLIKDLTILLLVSLPINILFHKIKLPSIMGFLIAGILIGPNGLHWVGDSETVKDLAEIGVILLLFVIGLEFSLRGIIKNLMTVIGVGGIQIALTVLAVFLICVEMGMPTNQGIAFGLLIALSSTAIVLKMITDRAELDTTHGQICVGVLLFQDLCVVPMMLIIPLLAQGTGYDLSDLGLALLKSIAAVGFIFILSRLIVPRTLGIIVRLGSKEHLTLFVILIILGTGWACQVLELSLAMGAFIAGLILSESEYNHQIILDILPLRDYFGGIFFISIGMLLQVQIFFDSPLWFLGITAGIIFLKAFLGGITRRLNDEDALKDILCRWSPAGAGWGILSTHGERRSQPWTFFRDRLSALSPDFRSQYACGSPAHSSFLAPFHKTFFQMADFSRPGG